MTAQRIPEYNEVMRFSSRPRSRLLSALVVTLTCGLGCTSLLGDFSSGGAQPGAEAGPGSDSGADAVDDAFASDVVVDDQAAGQDATPRDGPGVPTDGPSTMTEGGMDAGPDAPAWSPTTLDGQGKLALWLEASSANLVISSGVVGAWNDLSKNGNNATNTQGGPSVETAVIHGHDAVHFTARSVVLFIADSPSLQFALDQFCMVAVARASAGGGYFFSKSTAGLSGGGSYYKSGLEFLVKSATNDAGGKVVFPAAHVDSTAGNEIDWSGPGFEDGAYHVVVLRRTNGATLQLAIDSQTVQTATTGGFDVSNPEGGVTMGGLVYGGFNAPVDLSVAELLVVHASSGVVADADVASLTTYLRKKYAL